ncbi:MAG: Ig-like domain-containing protein, partial [Dehalococcoidia bacterium]
TGAGVIAAPFEIVDFATGDVFSPRDPISQALGPITAASALGNSLNTTAIKTILAAGVPETIETLKRVGYTTFDNPGGYGPALITGGSEITLLDEVYAYSVLATNGVMRGQEALTTLRLDPDERDLEPTAILRVTDAQDRVIYEPEPQEEQVVGAEYAYQVTSILSDGSNQCITYGVCNALALDNGYPSAAKTGTSEPFADSREIGETWTVGYTPELVSGFWAGNADNAPIPGHLLTSTTVSLRGWKDFMVQAIEYLQLPDTDFERPAGVVSRQVCWPSGRLPTPSCPNLNRYESLYSEEVLPRGDYEDLSLEDRERLYDTWWQTVRIDTRTGRIASDQTPARYVSQQSRLVLPPEEVKLWGGFAAWAAANGVSGRVASGGAQPGGATADGDLAARIDSPGWGQVLSGAVNIRGRASSPDFQSFRLEWGRGNSPAAWVRINSGTSPVEGGTLGTWNTTGMADGAYTIRLLVDDAEAGRLFYQINVQVGVGGSTGDGGGTDGGGTDGGGTDGGGGGGTDGGGTDGGGGAPVVAISSPGQLAVVSGSISINGTASSQRLLQTRVEVTGNGATTVLARLSNNVEGGVLATWDTTTVPNGQYTIRVTLIDHQQGDSTTEHNVVVQN